MGLCFRVLWSKLDLKIDTEKVPSVPVKKTKKWNSRVS